MTREQLQAYIDANIAPKPVFFNTAAKLKAILKNLTDAIFDNAGSGGGLIYTNTTSTTSLPVSYNQVKNLTVNYIGAFAVGNVVRITARVAGFMGLFSNFHYLAEITAIDVTTKVISFSLINAGTNYTPACNNWTIDIVAFSIAGLEQYLTPYMKKQVTHHLFAPTSSNSFLAYLESESGMHGTAKYIFLKKFSFNQMFELIITVASIKEYEIYTIKNISPRTSGSNIYEPIYISAQGGTFSDGNMSIMLESYSPASNDYSFSAIRILRVGTVLYVI
jgi:hypothetical protein